jgi:hypothetical protein
MDATCRCWFSDGRLASATINAPSTALLCKGLEKGKADAFELEDLEQNRRNAPYCEGFCLERPSGCVRIAL